MRISVKLRLNTTALQSPVTAPEVLTLVPGANEIEYQSDLDLYCEVAAMSGPKCGLGVADFNGKLLVCGKY